MMNRIIAIAIHIMIIIPGVLCAHPWKPDHYVVIDTDGGLDDFRTINLMLASPNIRILAITTSNGVLKADEAFKKVKSLLAANYHEGILVGLNLSEHKDFKNCEPAMEFGWGKTDHGIETRDCAYNEVLNKVFTHCDTKVSFVNLGGLNTYKRYFSENQKHVEKVKEVIWTINTNNIKESFNYLIDSSAYQFIDKNNLPVTLVNGLSFGMYSDELIANIESRNYDLYRSLIIEGSEFTKVMYDESVVFYLLYNHIFSLKKFSGEFRYSLKQEVDISTYYLQLLSTLDQNRNQVFKEISTDTSDYIDDIQIIMDSTIKKYGKEEWNACAITSELHRHLGVYSLIGAKMGVRAKEYFGAGADELKIVSCAGLEPPFSCLNDGLQVSTGATLGHGLISVNENSKLPKADFEYLGQKISLSLKEEYRKKIAYEIKELSMIYGLDSNIYWDLVRDLAVKYWSNWDRHEIFDIEVK